MFVNEHLWIVANSNDRVGDDVFVSPLNEDIMDLFGSTYRTELFYKKTKIDFLQKKYKILDIGLTEIDIRNQDQFYAKINFDKKLYLMRKKL